MHHPILLCSLFTIDMIETVTAVITHVTQCYPGCYLCGCIPEMIKCLISFDRYYRRDCLGTNPPATLGESGDRCLSHVSEPPGPALKISRVVKMYLNLIIAD